MNSPLCEICKNKNITIDATLDNRFIKCPESESCPGFERQPVYDLNFEEAIMAMVKDWEICEPECGGKYRFNHVRSCFEMAMNSDMTDWWSRDLYYSVQLRKWRVVK